MTDETLQTGSWRLLNLRISPRHMELLPPDWTCFGSYSIECYIKSRATMGIESITKCRSAAIHDDP